MKKVLILGGGSGGLVASVKLAKIFRDKDDVEITVIDRNPYHEFQPSYPWVAFGFKDPDEIRRPLEGLSNWGIKFVNDEITEILPSKKKVKTKNGEFDYDFLIVSLGAAMDPDGIPGYKEVAHHPWSMEGALRLKKALLEFKGGNVVIGAPGPYYKCPPAPYEVAGQLDFVFRSKYMRKKVNIDVFHLTPGPLSNMGPAISSEIQDILDNKGIKFHGGFEIDRIDPNEKKVYSKDGRSLKFDLLILPPVHKPNPILAKSELAGPKGWAPIDPETFRSLKYPENVWIIGDGANAVVNLPPAGVVAHFQAEYVANQVAGEIRGGYEGDSFSPDAMCIMDFGDDAILPMCEFSRFYKDLSGPPSCGVIARSKAVRLAKFAFEVLWFAMYLPK